MERLLFECAIRAIFIAASTALILWVMRIKSAAVRHRLWTGVVLLMLVLPMWTAFGPSIRLRVLPPTAPRAVEAPSGQVAIPMLAPSSVLYSSVETAPRNLAETRPVPAPSTVIYWRSLLLTLSLTGALFTFVSLPIATIQAHRLIRSAILQDGRLTSGSCTTPITVGW